ncbi:GNAT family N-acetyltransferase [Acholeplasma vituli]|uniref:GNAT family N-acetyltransferase n=1 Tax=Paracholeplasma vituli TaxID=69473 RepID=A0ABT2PX86_9MOLU|nr:GNAT family N-acetyltransferase [Paracholeplasma vituli]MCU0105570.1 GNAT family N-acetyltransferase [Paracholeplasma vituli]
MIRYQTANSKTRTQAIQLSIDTFKSNMGDQFTLLFSQKNQKHMFLGLDDQKVVSMVNYYPSRISIDGVSFLAASIGSVCTNKAYRGQNIASTLLHRAEKQMLKESVDFTIISGSGGIYERFGALDVGYMHEYHLAIDKLQSSQSLKLRDYQVQDFDSVYSIYQKEKRRYIRSKNEFKQLLISQRVPDEDCDYPMVVLTEQDKIIGYYIMNRYPKADDIWIKELSGNRNKLYHGFHLLLKYYKKTELRFIIGPEDRLNGLIKVKPFKKITQEASIRIIHPTSFVTKLNMYLDKKHETCRVFYNGNYQIFKDEKTYIMDDKTFTLWVFGHPKKSVNNPNEPQKVVGIPLPLPWSHNLNYQ